MSVSRRIFNNLFWIFSSEVISKGLTFLGAVYLARVLGKAGFGLFSLSLAVGTYFQVLADMGVTGYGIREVAQHHGKAAELYSILNSMRFSLALLGFLLLGFSVFFLKTPSAKAWAILAGGLYGLIYSFSGDWVLFGLEKMKFMVIASFINVTLFLGGVYFFVHTSPDAVKACFLYTWPYVVEVALVTYCLIRVYGISFSFAAAPSAWFKHAKESFYFALNNIFNNLTVSMPLFFLGMWSSAEEIGRFSAPHRIMTLMIRAFALATAALYPVLSQLYIEQRDVFFKTHARFQRLLIWLAVPLVILSAVFSQDIVVGVFGAAYADSGRIFRVFAILLFIMLLRSSFGCAMMSAGFHRWMTVVTGSGAAFALLASAMTIGGFGGDGAVWSLVAGEIVVFLSTIILFRRNFHGYGGMGGRFLLKTVGAGFFIWALVVGFHFSLTLGFLFGFVAYFISSFVLGIVTRDDFLQLLTLAKEKAGERKDKDVVLAVARGTLGDG